MTELQNYAETIKTVYGDNIEIEYDEKEDCVMITNPDDKWSGASVQPDKNGYFLDYYWDCSCESVVVATYDEMYEAMMEILDGLGIEYEAA